MEKIPEAIIQVDDELLIRIYSGQTETSAPYNLEMLASERSGTGTTYLVDATGHVALPQIGRLELAGLTRREAIEKITSLVSDGLTNPIVHVRFTNFRITVVGEVRSPGTYVVSDERLTLLEGLGLAGYLTDFANRSNILVIRENNGQRQFGYLDLRSRDIFNSPFFYLQQNDQVYVEPDKYKATVIRDPVTRIFPYVSLVTSIATLVLALSR